MIEINISNNARGTIEALFRANEIYALSLYEGDKKVGYIETSSSGAGQVFYFIQGELDLELKQLKNSVTGEIIELD